jgi:hypothetical protein
MAEFISFDEGRSELANSGLPPTCYFLLSTKSCADHLTTDTLTAGVGEITGTGYTRQTESEPAASAGVVSLGAQVFATGAETDWPASVKSCVLVTTADDSGVAVCAWNLASEGTGRDMAGPNITETITPELVLA